jgi:hypothetical protein
MIYEEAGGATLLRGIVDMLVFGIPAEGALI